jgi:arylsulfatase A-like enzyme
MCLQLLELDRELGDFLKSLDATGVDYAVTLTADHGGLDIPERLRAKGVADAAWIDPALSAERMGRAAASATGLKGPIIVSGGPSTDIYLDPALNAADRARAINALLAAYRAHAQVSAVLTRDEIARVPMPTGDPTHWSTIQRVRASFDQERSGDLYVVLKPHIQPIIDTSRYVSTHGSPWDYDRRVPIVFWRPGFRGATIQTAVETADIMPTLAALVALPVAPTSVNGHCLEGTPAFCVKR